MFFPSFPSEQLRASFLEVQFYERYWDFVEIWWIIIDQSSSQALLEPDLSEQDTAFKEFLSVAKSNTSATDTVLNAQS